MSLTDFDVACDYLEEGGFDEVAEYLKASICLADYDSEYDARQAAEAALSELQQAIEGTRDRYEWMRQSDIDQLLQVINEWRERKDRIEELKARVAELERELADADR